MHTSRQSRISVASPLSEVGSLALVGNPDTIHVGAHLLRAARESGLDPQFFNSEDAYSAGRWLRKWNWWCRGRRPARLPLFNSRIEELCGRFKPKWLLSTGLAPIDERTLRILGELGVVRLNYLTDDPWNKEHRAPWFMKSLPNYDHVFSPRTANLEDLRRLGCREVSYLPFAYEPSLHFHDPPATDLERREFESDIVFAGGADRERVPFIAALLRAGYRVALYGGYWDRWSETRYCSRGHASPEVLRKAIGGAKVALCLVRRANRDGSCMRTFELAAMGACMLSEDTGEHRSILGSDGEATIYFRSIPDMLGRVQWLLDRGDQRQLLQTAVRSRIRNGRHTWSDRLQTMLKTTGAA